MISVLPLLIHGAGHLAIMCLTEVLEEIDAIACIQHWMDCLIDGFQDRKLATKNHLSNWLPSSLSRLPEQQVPVWSSLGCLIGVQRKTVTEPPSIAEQFQKLQEGARAALSPEVYMYLKGLQQPTSVDSLISGYLIGRVMSNDETYFASLPEITIDKAVLPRVESSVLLTMRPQSYLTTTQVLTYDQKSSPIFYQGFKYLSRVFPRWRSATGRLLGNLNYEVVPFITTSSAGNLPDDSLPSGMDRRLRAAAKKRVVAFISETKDYLDLTRFQAQLVDAVYAVGRNQILRRARTVAGVNNPRILASLPILRVIEQLQYILPQASSGKQRGDVSDMLPMLYYTSSKNVLCSSMDVSGFDASVQMVSQTQFLSMISEALKDVPCDRYLCYQSFKHKDPISGSLINVSALSYLISDIMTRCQPQSSHVKDAVLPYLNTADPTFPSGLAYTTVHHTIRLISAIFGDISDRIPRGQISSLRDTSVQGDDKRLAFVGPLWKCERDLRCA